MTNVYTTSGGTAITNTISDDGDITLSFIQKGIIYSVSVDNLKINFKKKTMQISAQKIILNDQGDKVANGDTYFITIPSASWAGFYDQTLPEKLGISVSKNVVNAIAEYEFEATIYDKATGAFLG